MRKSLIAAAGALAVAGVISPAVAHADTSANTNVTFVIAGGGGNLSIIAGPLGTIVPQLSGVEASGSLPLVTVSDNRNGSPRGWTTTASSTDFVGPDQTIPKSDVSYNATALAGKVGAGSVTSAGWQDIGTATAVATRSGLNMPVELITWTPLLKVKYPDGAAIGSYTGTITVSVA